MDQDPIMVRVDAEIADLIPIYLGRRRAELIEAEAALARGDLELLRSIGHTLKGSGGGFGFDALTDLGGELEEASKAGNTDVVANCLLRLRDFLARVQVEAEE